MTLVIYDNAGFIISQMQGNSLREPIGIPFLWIDVPQGKYVVSIDISVTPHTPVFADVPETETQLLQKQVDALNIAMAEILGV